MREINYFGGVVKILENPIQKLINKNNKNISLTKFRGQLSQVRSTKIVNLVFWGILGNNVANFYNINDYILIEGILAVPKKGKLKKVEITVLKVYPVLFTGNSL